LAKTKSKKMLVPVIVTVIATLTIASAWYQWSEEKKSKKEAKLSEAKADSLNNENRILLHKIGQLSSSSNEQLIQSGKDLLAVNKQLNSAQETINNMRLESLNNILGSNQTYFQYVNEGSDFFGSFYNPTNHPIYDLHIIITNYSEILNCKYEKIGETYEIDGKCWETNSLRIPFINVISGERSVNIPTYKIDITKTYKLQITINYRKGVYYQDYIFKKGVGDASRIYEFTNNKKAIMRTINKPNMNVDWDKEFPIPPYMKTK
jgi:hypothetical protein